MKFIVLGHTGFVGKNLTKFLIKNKHEVFGISTKQCDLRNYSDFDLKIKHAGKFDAVFNCAANVGSVHYVTEKAAEVISDNTYISLNLYKTILKYNPKATIVNLLSNCCYSSGMNIQEEEKWLDGPVHDSVFSFGNFKRVLYYISKCYEMQYNISSINLMFPGIYGPGDSKDPNKVHALNGMIIRMLSAIENKDNDFKIWGTGNPIREWIYIEDVSKILLKSLECKKIIEPVNVSQGVGFKISETAKNIAVSTGFKGSLEFDTSYQDGAPIKILGKGRFFKFFGDYKFYDHKEGIDRTVKYYSEVL